MATDFDPSTAKPLNPLPQAQFDPGTAKREETPTRSATDYVRDAAAWAAKGAVAVPEAVVGLADIATGGRAGKLLENEGGAVGFRPKQAREAINEWHSDATKEAQRKFQEAEGLGGKFKAAVENPSNIVGAVVESLPAMGAGGVAARALGAATRLGQAGAKGAAAAGALGEGVVGAGSAAEQIRQETDDGLLSPGQVAAAAATGAATAGFGYAGGRVAQRLGIGDAETMLAQGNKGIAKQFADDAAAAATNPLLQQRAVKSIPRQVIEGAISEGFLEELPQSVAEQIFQNLALGKDWSQDVDTAVVLGTLSGAAMGGGAAGYRAAREPRAGAAEAGQAVDAAGQEDQQAAPDIAGTPDVAAAPAPGAAAEPDAPVPNPGLDAVRREFDARMSQMQQEEGGEPEVPQSAPPDGAAALAQQRAAEQDRRDAESAANRAVESPDDEILQSTGAAPLSPSRAMGLDPAAGSLSAAAAIAVDSGAAAQVQQANAMAQAAEEAARAPAKKKASERQVTADPATGEIEGGAMATWTDEDLSNAFRSAQAKNVRLQLARELSRRRAERDQQTPATAPAASANPSTQQGSIDGTQADQAQPPRAESSPAAGAQGAPVARPGPAQGLTNGTTSSQHDGAQAGAAPGPQAQAPVQTPAQRIDAGRAAWASMPTAERKALAKRVGGVNAAIKGSLHGARWENLNAELQLRLADAMQAQGATNDSTAPAVRLADERPAGPSAAAEAGGGEPAGRAADAQPAGPRGGSAGQPAAGVQSAVLGRSGASEQAAAVASADAPAPTAGQQQAVAIAQQGNEARRAQLMAASERWTSMPAAERQAVAKAAKGLNAPARAGAHTRAWADLAPKVREKLAAAMPDAAAAPATPAAAPSPNAPVRYQGKDADKIGPAIVAVREHTNGQIDKAALIERLRPLGLTGAQVQSVTYKLGDEFSMEDVRAVLSGGASQVDAAGREAATSERNDQHAPIDVEKEAIQEYGLPADTQFKPGKGTLGSGKWTASVGGQSSALSSTVDEAAKSLAGFLSMDRARAEAEAERQALAGTVAEKLKRGEKPTDVELRDLFGLAPNHTYVEQAAVGQFLVDHMGVPRNGIRKALGAAAGDRTSDGGAKYPIVYPRKLHDVFGPKQADAAPAPRPPRGVLAKKAAAEEAARADYFAPGNIVKGYGDSHVRVVSYTPANADGVWSVTVRQVEKQGSGWEDVPGVRERTHATPPSARELKAGPVERTEELPFRRGEAEAQGLTDDQMANLLRIMRPEPAAFSDAARAQAVGQVRETVDAIRKGWSNGPEVVVAFDMSDPAVPEAARRADLRQRSGGASGAPEGFYWRGKAYLLASKLNTPADAARVLHHEVLGHHGLRGMFGPELNKILNQVATMRQAEVAAKIKEYGLRGVTDLSRRHAAEEVLAEMAEKTPQLHFVRRAVAAIRNWLRANVPGFKGLKLSDADIIQGYILPAREFVERGQRAATDRIEPVFSRSDSPAITPDAIIGSTLGSASKHPDYAAAKAGDVAAATRLAVDLVTPEMVTKVAAALGGARPRVLPVAAEESSGRNKIPRAVAEVLAARLGLETATGIVQANRAQRTGLDGLDRIFAPVDFAGTVEPGDYLLVDDTLTQGGTFAALASHIREGGGNVSAVVALTGKQYSARIQPSPETLASLRQKHGDLEDQFRTATGYGFDALTESEARYLSRFEPAQRLRDRIAEEGRRAGERADQGNPRQGDAGDELSFSRSRLSEIKDSALDQLQKTMSHPGKVSVWDKTIGTMRHLAERAPAFKPVYETAQRNIDDVSMLANDAADRAPRLLPRVDTIGDLVGKNRKTPVSAADNKAVAKPLFEGTLLWGRDVDGKAVLVDELAKKYGNLPADDKAQLLLRAGRLDDRMLRAWRGLPLAQYEALVNSRFESKMLKAGAVWTDAELQTMFGATPNQIALYREARADMMRALGDEYAGLRDMVLDAPKLSDALELLTTTLQEDAKAKPDMAERLLQMNNLVVDRAATAKDLQDGGYAPLSRFGRYTLDVVDQDGNRQYFGMYETMKDANLAKIQMAQAFPGAKITQGTMSQQSFKLFAGITPETLEIFKDMVVGKEADAATRKVFDEYLKLTKNNHSALKRLIQRKGIEGYSQDVGRVVANFIYSNARQGAAGLNAGTMDRAINDIPKEQGELKDLAMGLRSYIRDPQEEGQAVRGMLFAQYLGGSLASAAVNMTQPFAVTLPWLSQFGGIRAASGQMARALKDMGTRGMKYETDLAHALKSAEDDGVVSPQEVHQLMAQARGAGGLRSGDGTRAGDARAAAGNAWERAKVAWGQPFALAEQFNRRSTFIAAFRIAKAQGMPDPGAFARKAVLETQFVYSKANKPQWARGAVAGTLFTFKTYSVSYLELMQRMWKQGGPEGKRAVGWALAMLLLMGGAGGVPFMEDAEDLIDGVGQMMGYNLSSKQWRKEALAGIVGKELGEFMEQGLSGLPGAPIDVSGRLGMGNLLPGTGLLLTKQSRERDLLEVVGPAGDLVSRGFAAGRELVGGVMNLDPSAAGRAALEVSPTAVRNAVKGLDMAASGMYKDTKGYKVIDTTLAEAVAKAIGFQPKSVAEIQDANSFMQRAKSFYSLTSSEIKAQWADALFRKDEGALARVRERLADWNKNNPEQPIIVKMPDVWKKVREMGKDRIDRIADNSPKALRQQMREMAAETR